MDASKLIACKLALEVVIIIACKLALEVVIIIACKLALEVVIIGAIKCAQCCYAKPINISKCAKL